MMLDNIKQDSGEKVAMEVLDTLRSLRQMSGNQSPSKLRMVFTGSIGLHHVISSLKQAGYANAPTNDLNAAVRYRETKGDKRALLELPIEERNLLKPLLGLSEAGQ